MLKLFKLMFFDTCRKGKYFYFAKITDKEGEEFYLGDLFLNINHSSQNEIDKLIKISGGDVPKGRQRSLDIILPYETNKEHWLYFGDDCVDKLHKFMNNLK
jgi:hypothetical protein